jgi:hypothetical protein
MKHAFYIPMKAIINVEMREANIDLAVSQAEGEIQAVFDLLDDLRRVDDPKYKIPMTKEEIIDLLQVGWASMSYASIEEAIDES